MARLSGADAFPIGRRAESDIINRLPEDNIRAEIRRACRKYLRTQKDLDDAEDEIFTAAKEQVSRSYRPVANPTSKPRR